MRGQSTGDILKQSRPDYTEPAIRPVRFNGRSCSDLTDDTHVSPVSADELSARIEKIKSVWSQGAGNSIELARVVWDARKQLLHGQWEHLSKSLPFSKRKANMLVTIGKGLGWATGQMFAQLPSGWSILYQLAQLNRRAFEQLVLEGVIHPKLSLQEARELLGRFKGRHNSRAPQKDELQRRLQQFRLYIRRALREWKPVQRELTKRELTRLLELINGAEREPLSFASPPHHKNSVTSHDHVCLTPGVKTTS